tara:strand:- start:129 stop:323 length:195 start_codon:yes stop_codon:yes gene_type:complete
MIVEEMLSPSQREPFTNFEISIVEYRFNEVSQTTIDQQRIRDCAQSNEQCMCAVNEKVILGMKN